MNTESRICVENLYMAPVGAEGRLDATGSPRGDFYSIPLSPQSNFTSIYKKIIKNIKNKKVRVT